MGSIASAVNAAGANDDADKWKDKDDEDEN